MYSYYISHMPHGTGIFAYVWFKFIEPNVGKIPDTWSISYTGFRDDNGT